MRSNRDARYVTRALEFIKLHLRNHGRVELLPDHHSARSRARVENVPARRSWVANRSCFEHLSCLSRQFIELGLTLQPARRQVAHVSDAAVRAFAVLGKKTNQPQGFAPGLTQATPAPSPIVFRVMELAQAQKADTDNRDPLRGMRGVGVLLRRAADAPNAPPSDPKQRWYSLNVATLADGPKIPLLVSSRLGYDRDIRVGLISYNNGPLPVSNLLQEYSRRFVAPDPQLHTLFEKPLFQLVPYEGSDTDPADIQVLRRTPMLRFGDTFDAQFFAVTNVGAVPQEIAGAHPAKLNPAKLKKLGQTKLRIPYGRSVRVGHMSICNVQNKPMMALNSHLPSAPADVWPRAREIASRRSSIQSGDEIIEADSLPLVFLIPDGGKTSRTLATSTSFELRLPSVDVQTWERWIGYKFPEDKRAAILDAAMQSPSSGQSTDCNQTGISDPSIAGVAINLYGFDGSEWKRIKTPAPIEVKFPSLTTANTLQDLSRNAIPVEIGVAKSGDSPIEMTAAGTVKVRVTPGEIYELEAVVTLVPDAASKFAPIYSGFKEIPGIRMLIESASPDIPSAAKCLELTKTNFSLPDSRLVVTFTAPLTGDDGSLPDELKPLRHVHKVEFMRQVWYWTGRVQSVNGENLNQFPAVPDSHQRTQWLKDVKTWESTEFAERPDFDHLIVPATDPHSNNLDAKGVATTPKGVTFTYSEDLSGDKRALYYRFATRVYSRYAGAFDHLGAVSTLDLPVTADVDGWARCFVPSRVRALDTPKIKALFPLTESAFAQQAPGLIVVFDGPAYDQAGLAERLRIDIEQLGDPNNSQVTYLQAAPDPQVSKAQFIDASHGELLEAVGPIGHTFDDATTTYPKFGFCIFPTEPRFVDAILARVHQT